jgi:hypothetical protein
MRVGPRPEYRGRTKRRDFFALEKRANASYGMKPYWREFDRSTWPPATQSHYLSVNPNKLTLIFCRRITRNHGSKFQTVIEDLNFPSPVVRSH